MDEIVVGHADFKFMDLDMLQRKFDEHAIMFVLDANRLLLLPRQFNYQPRLLLLNKLRLLRLLLLINNCGQLSSDCKLVLPNWKRWSNICTMFAQFSILFRS